MAIVEDDDDIREILQEVITEDAGHEVVCYSGGRAALAGLITGARLPDLILLDLYMHDGDGWELLETLERAGLRNKLKIVILSASAVDPPPGIEFVRKPLDIATLLRLLATHV